MVKEEKVKEKIHHPATSLLPRSTVLQYIIFNGARADSIFSRCASFAVLLRLAVLSRHSQSSKDSYRKPNYNQSKRTFTSVTNRHIGHTTVAFFPSSCFTILSMHSPQNECIQCRSFGFLNRSVHTAHDSSSGDWLISRGFTVVWSSGAWLMVSSEGFIVVSLSQQLVLFSDIPTRKKLYCSSSLWYLKSWIIMMKIWWVGHWETKLYSAQFREI